MKKQFTVKVSSNDQDLGLAYLFILKAKVKLFSGQFNVNIKSLKNKKLILSFTASGNESKLNVFQDQLKSSIKKDLPIFKQVNKFKGKLDVEITSQ